jgi:Putative enzyme of poly-gamma-glutamate biosynthesis (capsule formation)
MKTVSWVNSMKRAALLCALIYLLLPCAKANAITISMVGDCTIGNIRYSEGRSSFVQKMTELGMDYPFSNFVDVFLNDDLTVANCENVFTAQKTPANKEKLSLYSPPEWAEVFVLGGVDVVNTENNHTYDFGRKGRQETLDALDAQGVSHYGGGELAIMETAGIKIGFTGYTFPHREDITRQVADIQTLREAGCDLVIVSMHWGREESLKTTREQQKLGPQLIDAGADVVYGHGPHVLQAIEIHNGKPIFYSLANFTFGGNANPKDPDTAVVSLEYEEAAAGIVLKTITVTPARMHDNRDFRPYAYTEQKDIDRVLKKLNITDTVIIIEPIEAN